MIGTCILCLATAEMTSEHVFPEAIGGGLEVPALCVDCNSFLGNEVDVLLTDDPLIKMIRSGLALKSKSGCIPAPLHRGELVGHEGSHASVHVNADGTHTIRPELSHRANVAEDGRKQVRVIGSERDVRAALKKIVDRAKRDGEKVVVVDEGEHRVENPVVRVSWLCGVAHLIRPTLKIAYELTAGWLGPAYLRDPQAVSIRNCITTGNAFDIDAEIGYFPPVSNFNGIALPSTDHAAALVLGEGWVRCVMRIFNVIEAVVLVSEHRERYKQAAETFLAFDSIGRTVRHRLPHPDAQRRAEIEWSRTDTHPEKFEVKTFLDGRMTYETALELATGAGR